MSEETKSSLMHDWFSVTRDLNQHKFNPPKSYISKVIDPFFIGCETLYLGWLSSKIVRTPIKDGEYDDRISNVAYTFDAVKNILVGSVKTIDGALLLIPRVVFPFESPWKTRIVTALASGVVIPMLYIASQLK